MARFLFKPIAEIKASPSVPLSGPGSFPSLPSSVTCQGDDWGAALAEHDRWLRTAVLARLGDGVDEVMQEVALAVVGHRVRPSDVESPGAWLYRIALRKVLLHRRSRGRRAKLLDRYAHLKGEATDTPSEPLDWLLLDERKAFVREALRRLPPRDAEILLLKYTEDWSYREIARRLGISESAVEARLHRARCKLREALTGSSVIEIEASR